MQVAVEELDLLFQRAIAHLKSNGGRFDLETDYDALVPTDEWQNLEHPPLVIGSLFDDAAELKRVVAGEIPFTAVDLERLAALLRALSQSSALV